MRVNSEPTLRRSSTERLVLEGCRNWSEDGSARSVECWVRGRQMFAEALGHEKGKQAFDALSQFIETLGLCSRCPLKTQRRGADGLCRDEVFILGLLSGIQYGDEDAVHACLTELSCTQRCQEVAFAAGELAITLKALGLLLNPISASALLELRNVPNGLKIVH